MSSWITTLAGVATAVGGALVTAEETTGVELPDWARILGLILSVVGPAVLGAAARDNNKSSQRLGVK